MPSVTTIYHPRPDDKGKSVLIKRPSTPTPASSWSDSGAVACFVPDGPAPAVLNGVAVSHWSPPKRAGELEALAARAALDEPEFAYPKGLQPAAGAVVLEPDGRAWAVAPSNGFGGHRATFPKGRTDGKSLKMTALIETWEETGLAVELTSWLCDVDRSVTRCRFYLARRIGGSPAAMGWESQACVLAPVQALRLLLTHPADQLVLDALETCMER